MRFEAIRTPSLVQGQLVYRPDEHSFDYVQESRQKVTGVTSILVNDLQLQLDEEGRVLYPFGLCSHLSWKSTLSTPPTHFRGQLKACVGAEIVPGVSRRYTDPHDWFVWRNATSGWVCLGAPDVVPPFQAVEFATRVIGVVKNGELVAIWLLPEVLAP